MRVKVEAVLLVIVGIGMVSLVAVLFEMPRQQSEPERLGKVYPALNDVQQIHSIVITNSFSGWGRTAAIRVTLQSNGTQFTGVGSRGPTDDNLLYKPRESRKLVISQQAVQIFLQTLGSTIINAPYQTWGETKTDGGSRLEIVLETNNFDRLKISCRDTGKTICYYPKYLGPGTGRWVVEVAGKSYPVDSNKPYEAFLLVTPFVEPYG